MLGLLISFLFVFLIISLVSILLKYKILSQFTARKTIQIGVSNWWLIAIYFYSNAFYPMIISASFIALNYFIMKKKFVKAMETSSEEESLGIVYFPIVLLILSGLCFGGYIPLYLGTIGILIMGYGDGLSAIIGKKFGQVNLKFINKQKTIAGSVAMLISTFIITAIILATSGINNYWMIAGILALTATVVESITPWGIDNLTVPFITVLVYYLIYL